MSSLFNLSSASPRGRVLVALIFAVALAGAGAAGPPLAPPTAGPRVLASSNTPAAKVGTNPATAGAAPVKAGTNQTSAAFSKFASGEFFKEWPSHPAFYPAIGALVAVFLTLLIRRVAKDRQRKLERPAGASAALPGRDQPAKRAQGCNILQWSEGQRRLWHFDLRGGGVTLGREQISAEAGPLPARLVGKDWRSLYQRKLNVAWLPPQQVFLRVAELPASGFAETLSMVELQLEKLSPMPVAQVVWSLYRIPHPQGNMQSVVVLIVARSVVEEFLGQLEGQGFLADRLEMPMLDQIRAPGGSEEGAWIYPEGREAGSPALVTWWYGGCLRNVDLVTLPAGEPAAGLREQLTQMAWAGELEGWMTASPRWHLVADEAAVAVWEPGLRQGLDQPITLAPALPASELAALTARRAATAGVEGNLLPREFTERYHQQFVDRLWMRGLGAVAGIYLLGVAIYFVALGFATWRTTQVEQQMAQLGPTYTNAIQLRDRLTILKDRQDLKFAALDCWKKTAELLPENVTLDSMNFSDGRRLSLSGTAPADAVQSLLDFEGAMRKAKVEERSLFDAGKGDNLNYRANPGGSSVSWSFGLELLRAEQ